MLSRLDPVDFQEDVVFYENFDLIAYLLIGNLMNLMLSNGKIVHKDITTGMEIILGH